MTYATAPCITPWPFLGTQGAQPEAPQPLLGPYEVILNLTETS